VAAVLIKGLDAIEGGAGGIGSGGEEGGRSAARVFFQRVVPDAVVGKGVFAFGVRENSQIGQAV